jgi:hypothetical protein
MPSNEDIIEKLRRERVEQLPELWLAACEIHKDENSNLRYALEAIISYLETRDGGDALLREMERDVRLRISRKVMRDRQKAKEKVA